MPSTHECEAITENATNAAIDLTPDESMSSEHKALKCAFCQKLPAICKVERLRIRGDAADDFVKVLLPYCGVC